VRVGSANEPKIAAVRAAIAAYAPRASVEGAAVESGVSDQPVGAAEIARGARNRARAALALGSCDLAVGYEDGLLRLELGDGAADWLNMGCAVVCDGQREGLGFSSGFAYPPAIAERAAERREPIGELFDALWSSLRGGQQDVLPSAQREGNIGKLSLGVLSRSDYARHAVVCALLRFVQPDLYDAGDTLAARGRPESRETDRSLA
jgi:inosine/xanthosine triphosphatase